MYHLTPVLAGSREQSFALQAGVPLGVWHRVKTMNRVRALQTPRTEVIHNRSYLKTLSNWSRSRPRFLMNEWINTLIYRDPTFPLMSWFLAAVVRKSAPACVRAQSQTGSWWVLDVRAVPGLWYRLWSPWTGSQGATVLKRVWKNLNFVSVFFCRLHPVGFFSSWPLVSTGEVCSWVWSGLDESLKLQVWGHGSLLENHGLPSPDWGWSAVPKQKEVLFISTGKWSMTETVAAASVVMQ